METVLESHYLLGAPLGTGSLGDVFAATGPDGREFAVKLLHAGLTGVPAAVAKFLRAQSALVGLTHPNLVTLHDLVVTGDTVVLVLDRVPGGPLGPTAPGDLARIAAGIASALATVHDAGLAHGDVKPENVLLDADGVPKLADTGVAGLVPHQVPRYLAPEGGPATPAMDLYALGALIYELCGDLPASLRNVLPLLLAPDPAARPAAEKIAALLSKAAT
jgi:serine/threonine protein kinase